MNESAVEEILKAAAALKEEMWGIRGRETGEFIAIGFVGDELIYGTPPRISGANLWHNFSDAEAAYAILAQDGNFAEGHFVGKASDAEAEALETAFLLKSTLLNFNCML